MVRAGAGNIDAITSIFLSHKRAIERAISVDGTGVSIVLEDDCHFPNDVWGLDLSSVPDDWTVVFVSPRFKDVNAPETRPQLTFIQRLNPFRKKYWEHPLRPLKSAPLSRLHEKYTATGAHFVIYRNKDALRMALDKLSSSTTIYHVDMMLMDLMPGAYALNVPPVSAGGFGSDNR